MSRFQYVNVNIQSEGCNPGRSLRIMNTTFDIMEFLVLKWQFCLWSFSNHFVEGTCFHMYNMYNTIEKTQFSTRVNWKMMVVLLEKLIGRIELLKAWITTKTQNAVSTICPSLCFLGEETDKD